MNNSPFLLGENTFGLMLNVDWYQPYKHSTYSIGVMYLVVMNLPRSERYRRRNLIVVGIIPGPSEPSITINSYLRPLIDELNKLWKGVTMKLPNGEKTVHAALLCTGCDIPAGKKLCGFKGWGTARGVTGVLRNSKEVSTSPMLISTEHLGQSVLTVSSVNKLKRSTLLELKRLLKPSMAFGTHAYSIYHTMIQYECLPLWTRYITSYTCVQQSIF